MPTLELTNFSGGVNTRSSPLWTPDGGPVPFQTSNNWELSETGIIKYTGCDGVLGSAISGTPTITGIFTYKSGSTRKMVVCAGTKIYTVAGGTATEIHTGQTSGAFYQAEMWNNGTNDLLLLCNGVDKVVVYNGTTAAAIAETDPSSIWADARPQGVEVVNNRVCYWGDPTHPYRLYFPMPFDISTGEGGYANFTDTTDTAGAFDVYPGTGGYITGVKTLTDDLCIIYKERSICRMSGYSVAVDGYDPITFNGITDEVGCVAPRSLVQVGNDQYFMAENGLRQLRPVEAYGDTEHQQPTFNIQAEINEINWAAESAYKNICATYFKAENQIYISCPTGSSTTNNQIYVYDVITKSLDPRSGFTASVLATYNRDLYHGGYAGQLFQHGDDDNYDGVAISASATTKWLILGGIGAHIRFDRLVVWVEGGGGTTLTIQWEIIKRDDIHSSSDSEAVDSEGGVWGTGVWGTAEWASSSQRVWHKKRLGRGCAIRFRFINNELDKRPKIRRVYLDYTILNKKRG